MSLSSIGVETWSDLWSETETQYGEDLDLELGQGKVEEKEGLVDTMAESGELE